MSRQSWELLSCSKRLKGDSRWVRLWLNYCFGEIPPVTDKVTSPWKDITLANPRTSADTNAFSAETKGHDSDVCLLEKSKRGSPMLTLDSTRRGRFSKVTGASVSCGSGKWTFMNMDPREARGTPRKNFRCFPESRSREKALPNFRSPSAPSWSCGFFPKKENSTSLEEPGHLLLPAQQCPVLGREHKALPALLATSGKWSGGLPNQPHPVQSIIKTMLSPYSRHYLPKESHHPNWVNHFFKWGLGLFSSKRGLHCKLGQPLFSWGLNSRSQFIHRGVLQKWSDSPHFTHSPTPKNNIYTGVDECGVNSKSQRHRCPFGGNRWVSLVDD